MLTLPSTYFHPMRYMRTRPFARRALQLYARLTGRGIPSANTSRAIGDLIVQYYNDVIDRWPPERRLVRPTAMLVEEASLACHVGSFTQYGRNIFQVQPQLLTLLSQTDLDGVRVADIKLPFDSFYVSFGSAFPGALPGPPNQIDGAYVSELQPGYLQIVVTCRRTDVNNARSKRWPLSRDKYFYAPLKIYNREETFENLMVTAIQTREIPTEPEPSLTEPDPDLFTDSGVIITDSRYRTAQEHSEYCREAVPTFRHALGVIVNSLCYLNAVEADSFESIYPEDAPRDLVDRLSANRFSIQQKARALLLDEGFMHIKLVGEKRIVDHEYLKGEGEVCPHWRRGHWRRQPVGQARTDRRLIWIKPTIVRGDKGDPKSGHLYTIE